MKEVIERLNKEADDEVDDSGDDIADSDSEFDTEQLYTGHSDDDNHALGLQQEIMMLTTLNPGLYLIFLEDLQKESCQ